MRTYRRTLIGLCVSITIFLATLAGDLDLFERFASLLDEAEAFEIDELVIPVFIFGAFAIWDFAQKRKKAQLELEKVKVYKAMLTSTHHILNNFLNQMQLFRLTAESTPDFDPEVIQFYDQILADTVQQIEALSSITNVDETAIWASIAPKDAPTADNR